MRYLVIVLSALLFVACGDDATKTQDFDVDAGMGADSEMPEDLVFEANCEGGYDDPLLRGRMWLDPEDTAVSWYQQAQEPGAAGKPGVEIELLLDDGSRQGALTCDDGTFRFPDAVGEVALMSLPGGCTTANCPTRFYEAANEGAVKVVTFGDSIPAFGPEPWFPQRFADLAAPVANVQNVNVAVPGSTSVEWLPETRYFENRILPHVDADVWVFSIGGNDLQQFADGFDQANFAEQLGELNPLIEEIIANIRTIVQEIRELSPDADIVWVVYPNYGTTDYWKLIAGPDFEMALENGVGNILARVRRQLAGESGLHVVDILGATADEDLDSLLIDPLHLNEDGHDLYARELFTTLGGVVLDEPARGLERRVGYIE